MSARMIVAFATLAACSGDRAPVLSHPALSTPAQEPLRAEPAAEAPPPDRSIDISGVKPAEGEGLRFAARPVSAEPPEPPPRAKVEPLPEQDVKVLLARLPPIQAEAGDQRTFALREGPKPPPRSGTTVKSEFPPPPGAAPPAVEKRPLEVLRVQPQGLVAIAGHVSITFSQPMVPVETDAALQKEKVPASLSPQPEGQWRWAGTKTLLFEAKPRFPMATEYTLTIPAGVRSAVGGELQEPVTIQFSTPPPRLGSFQPTGGGHPLDPLMLARFDQRIDPGAVLRKIEVTANGKSVPLQLASPERIRKEAPNLSEPDRVVAFQPAGPLPKDANVEVTIGSGAPSAEGPLVATESVKHSFRTYGPLRYFEHRCEWAAECEPRSTMVVRFNNMLDEGGREHVTVSPKPAELQVEIQGTDVRVRGRFEPEAKHRVTIGAGLTDVYGQKLGRAKTVAFQLAKARPLLYASGDRFVVTDRPALPIYTVHHSRVQVRLRRVSPEDWFQYLRSTDEEVALPGEKVLDRIVAVKRGSGALSSTSIDLSPALTKQQGNVILEVEPVGDPTKQRRHERIRRWIQVTELGLDAVVDHQDLYAFATTLAEGKPLPGVELSILPGGPKGTADATGFARLPLPGSSGRSSSILMVRHGDRTAFLPESSWASEQSSWVVQRHDDTFRFFMFDDRGLYRPGETVHFKGWIRRITGGKASDVAPIGDHRPPIQFEVKDPRGNVITKGEAPLTALGGFTLSAALPKDVNLGWGRAEIRAQGLAGASGSYAFRIEEFRRPEFEVSAAASEGPHLIGQYAELEVAAKYFAGGPLQDAEVRWDLAAQPGDYAPPNRGDYSFGIWSPWWGHYDFIHRHVPPKLERVAGKTGPDGVHRVRVDLLAADPPRAMTLSAHAAVQDVNRQTWSAGTAILVHPAAVYVGLKPARSFVVIGQKLAIDAIRVDLDGAVAPGEVELTATPLWKSEDARTESCTRKVERDEAVTCEFPANVGGPWRIAATTKDERGRMNRSERVVWVAGGPPPAEVRLRQQAVELIPDRETYAPGDVAEVMVRAPFVPAEAMVTLRRQGVLRAERISLPQGTAVVRVPIEEAHLPNLNVHVAAVGRSGDRPAYAAGSLALRIPPVVRTLSIDLLPEAPILEPGEQTAVQVVVKDAKGAPVKDAEAAVFVVDEAVLALARYQNPDPIPTFYPTRFEGAADYHLRSHVLSPEPPEIEVSRRLMRLQELSLEGKMARAAEESGAAPEAPPPPPPPGGAPIRVRRDFSPLAVFSPEVITDAQGRARVELTMPDNLTRYRVIAVAVAGGKLFGSAESSITAKKALMVRPSPPRFLNYGDRFELAVVVQNQTNREVPAAVFARASNAAMDPIGGVLVRVPPQERALVSFPARALMPGTARFQVGIAAGGFDDAAELSIPVWTPATTEAFATYGELDRGAIRQPIGVPKDVEPSFGALEIGTSSTELQALTDALIYLVRYPFDCSEQIASRVLGVAALKDVLAAFEAEQLPPAAEIEATVAADVKRLEQLQNWDGGWGFWRRGDASWPFTSIHTMHALVRARDKGFAIPEQMMATGHRYLRSVEQHVPHAYPASVRPPIEAYALYVRALMGDLDEKKATNLIERAGGVEKLPLEVAGWLYPVLSDSGARAELAALRRMLDNRVTETAGAAHFASSHQEGGAYLILHSDRRADGLLLEGLIRDQPNSPLIPKLVRGLLAHRTAGRWTNTQENAWVLLALDRYFRTFEKTTPDFVVRAWLGERFAGAHEFRGRTTERHQIEVPMRDLMELRAPELIVSKEGEGRLYYRIGLRYAPNDLVLEAKSRGFEVERTYEAIDDPEDVARGPDGSYRIAAGARVRVRVTMTAPGRRHHVALVDPLPAGLEPLNPALGMSDAPPAETPWWMWRWYQHQNLRDDRAEAFTPLLSPGVHGYAYVARATTLGTFVAPPARAEEMYAPETFGRSRTDRVVVEARPATATAAGP